MSDLTYQGKRLSIGGKKINFYITPNVLKTIWNTENLSNSEPSTPSGQIKLPLYSGYTYDFTVDWGDGNVDEITSWDDPNKLHTYSTTGDYEINITVKNNGSFGGFYFNGGGDRNKLLEIKEWGNVKLQGMSHAFQGCENLIISATDSPDLSNVDDMSYAFDGSSINTKTNIIYGYLYNWFAVTGGVISGDTLSNKDINDGGWKIPNSDDWLNLITYADPNFVDGYDNIAGNVLRSTSFTNDPKWSTFNGDNLDTYGFYINPAGRIAGYDGSWQGDKYRFWTTDLESEGYAYVINGSNLDSYVVNSNRGDFYQGNAVRLVRPATDSDPSEQSGTTVYCDDYIGNDGKTYKTVRINNLVWLAENLAETLFYTGGTIPLANTDTEWETEDGATGNPIMAAPNYDINNAHIKSTPEKNISNWDITGVKNISYLLSNSIIPSDINNWDVSDVENMSHLFENSIVDADISGWVVSNVTDMSHMFDGTIITSDLSSWDVSNVENMSYIFANNASYLDISDWQPLSLSSDSDKGLVNAFYNNNNMKSYYYNNILTNWSALNLPSGVTADFPYKYYDFVDTERTTIINKGWTLNDFGMASKFVIKYNATRAPSFDLKPECYITWGDGESTYSQAEEVSHTYATSGEYTITFYDQIFDDTTGKYNFRYNSRIVDILEWGNVKFPVDAYNLFAYTSLSNVTATDSPNLSGVTSLRYMFNNTDITNIDLSSWDTSSIEDFTYFLAYTPLVSIDLSYLNTESATNLYAFFNGCDQLQSVNVSNWDVSNVTAINFLFGGCYALTGITGLETWDTSSVENMNSMFRWATSITSTTLTGITNWNTSSVTNMGNLFETCSKLESIDLSNWDMGSVKFFSNMFKGCPSLKNIDVTNWNTSNVEQIWGMFDGATGLTNITGLSTWDTSSIYTMTSLFKNCSSLISADFTGWDTSSLTSAGIIFMGCTSLTGVTGIDNLIPSGVTNIKETFKDCTLLETIDVSGWDTRSVTDMTYLFDNCQSLTSISGITNWNTSSLDAADYIFRECESLTTLDLSGWDVSLLRTGVNMFFNNTSLNTIDITGWNPLKLINPIAMFGGCSNLKTLSGSTNLILSGVTTTFSLFNGCTSLDTLDISGWDVSSVNTMSYMFNGCASLEYLDVSNWDTSSVTAMYAMFAYNTNLKIDLSSFTMSGVTDVQYMLNQCDINISGTTTNYDNTLISWNNQSLQPSLTFHATNCNYSSTAQSARDNMVLATVSGGDGWIIDDGGLIT